MTGARGGSNASADTNAVPPPSQRGEGPHPPSGPARAARVTAALVVGMLAAALTVVKARAFASSSVAGGGGSLADFDQVRYAAIALWRGQDPYVVIGPGQRFAWPWPFFYPLSAAVAFVPFAALPQLAARTLFVGGSAAALAFGLTRRGWHALLALLCPWGFYAIYLGQWTPALTAALALAPGAGAGVALGALAAAKPNVALALLGGAPWPRRRGDRAWRTLALAAGTFAVLVAASLIARPHWPVEWRATVRGATHFRPAALLPGGALALLALLRWRRPEARLVAALACVPQTFWWYDALPLALVPRTRAESLAFALGGWAAYGCFQLAGPAVAGTPAARFALVGQLTVAGAYIPSVLMVLRRPNEGEVPEWLDRAARRLAATARALETRVRRRTG